MQSHDDSIPNQGKLQWIKAQREHANLLRGKPSLSVEVILYNAISDYAKAYNMTFENVIDVLTRARGY